MSNSQHPHIKDKFSPLGHLLQNALMMFGDFAPGPGDPHASRMLLSFANQIVEMIRQHPYHDGTQIDYYTSLDESRPIPDVIMEAGLLALYSAQQNSVKTQMYMPMFYSTMNSVLWGRKNGNTKIQMKVVDGGTNDRNINHGITDNFNGLVSTEGEKA